ncbi:hypothetical protein AgCh_006037 [Apium graveolens]
MKRKYIMLALLIPGPKEPGNNIDIYLQPLIEDLKLLWDEGYGNLSGYTIKGAKACPICEDATIDLCLNNCKKNVYMGHRTFLPLNHPYRKRKKSFDGTVETRVARLPLTGSEVLERVKDIDVVLGKFLVGTLLNIPGKSKDGMKARLDMQEMGIRVELAPQQSGKRAYLPPACYTLSGKEKNQLFKVIDPMTLDTLQADIIVTLSSTDPVGIPRSRHEGRLEESHTTVSSMLKWLGYGPDMPVRSYQGFDVNGYTFYTQCQDNKSTVQNSGVSVEASSTEFDRGNSITSRDIKKSYYGVIEEIWELDYKDFKVALFRYDPFIFATQVKQVFYIKDPADSRWSIVLESKRRILGIYNVEDEDEYDQFDENPPFSIGLPTAVREDNVDTNYVRNDHDEGLWIDRHDILISYSFLTTTFTGSGNVEAAVAAGAKEVALFASASESFSRSNINCGIEDSLVRFREVAIAAQKLSIPEISEKAKDSKKHDEHVHFLGPSGYYANRAKWCVDDPISSLDDSECIDESILSSQHSGRSYDWIRARVKKKEGGGYYFPNLQTKEVFAKMGEFQRQVSDGSWTPQDHDDILSRALGRKEHGGRARGLEEEPKLKKYLDQGSPNRVGLSIPEDNVFNDIGIPKNETVRSSCQSVNRQDHISNIKDPISMDKEKGHDISPKKVVMMPKKVESKGSVTPVKKSPDDDTNSTEHCRSLRFFLKKLSTNKKGSIFKYEENGEDPIYVAHEDVDQFLKMSWLNIPILEFFLNDHWMLLLFCLHESVIYVFDSLKKERKIRLTTPARTAFKLYVPEGGKRNNRKEFLWIHTEVECPQQEGGTECGFFVMKYMHDIVMLCQKDLNTNWKVVPDFAEILECWTSQAK